MTRSHMLPTAFLALTLALAACSSGSGDDPDRDRDGIPNHDDALPDDPARFASYAPVLLDGLAGGIFASAVGINDGGTVVGLSDDAQGTMKAVRWTVSAASASAPTRLDPVDGGYGAAYAVAANGLAVGESQKAAELVAVAWPAGATSPVELSLAGAGPPAAAYGVSGDRIVGEASGVAVLWSGTGADPVLLGTLGGATSAAYAVSGAGLVVGESLDGQGATRGALWRLGPAGAPAAPVALPPLPGHVASVALGVSDAGEIAGESEAPTGEVHAVLWTLDAAGAPGSPLDLGRGSATAVNAASRVAGHRAGPALASVWDLRNVDLAGAVLGEQTSARSHVFGMNDLHSVVGCTDDRAFVAVSR